MPSPIFLVDAFADRPFTGNPAAVCPLDGPADAGWMQQVAAEMNLSETAFFYPDANSFHLRWFTPTTEVDLCGHATLASAHVLWEEGLLPPEAEARFHTRSGVLTTRRKGDQIEMDFPARPATAGDEPPGLREALDVEPVFCGQNGMDFLVEVRDESAVRGVRPDFERLRRVPLRGVIVTAAAENPALDFVSRFFAPNAGVNEDPVTGSAHCCLGPYWQGRLGKSNLIGYQASARGGFVGLQVQGERVFLYGSAVTVMRGELRG